MSSPGKMSKDRALRKQQQLNNLASAVTKLAKPGDVIVDFCSGGVMYIFVYMMQFLSAFIFAVPAGCCCKAKEHMLKF